MTQATITTQDQYLLNLIASGESSRNGGDPYCSLYPSTYNPNLVTMTIAQVIEFQRYRTTSRSNGGLGIASSACGRYQFIRSTLESVVNQVGIDKNTRFTPQVQDYLIIENLRKSRGYDSWKSGAISDAQFQLNLAKEFASIPVPFNTQGAHRVVQKGESYYAGDRLNKSHHNPDVFLQNLSDIRKGGPGSASTIDIVAGSGGYTPEGNYLTTQTEIAAAGGQRFVGGIGAEQPMPRGNLPSVDNPYLYKRTDPLDNRYDFRTGQSVRELLVNGVNPVAANALIPGNGSPPPADIGSGGYSPDAAQAIASNNPMSIGYNTNQVDPRLAAAVAKSTNGSSAPITKPAAPPAPTTPPADTIKGNSLIVPRQIRDLLAR